MQPLTVDTSKTGLSGGDEELANDADVVVVNLNRRIGVLDSRAKYVRGNTPVLARSVQLDRKHGIHHLHKILIQSGKFIVAIAALWAVGASLYIFFSPVTINGVTSTLRRDSSEIVEAFTRQQSWYEAQGLWGVLVLVIFSGFYLLAALGLLLGALVLLASRSDVGDAPQS